MTICSKIESSKCLVESNWHQRQHGHQHGYFYCPRIRSRQSETGNSFQIVRTISENKGNFLDGRVHQVPLGQKKVQPNKFHTISGINIQLLLWCKDLNWQGGRMFPNSVLDFDCLKGVVTKIRTNITPNTLDWQYF